VNDSGLEIACTEGYSILSGTVLGIVLGNMPGKETRRENADDGEDRSLALEADAKSSNSLLVLLVEEDSFIDSLLLLNTLAEDGTFRVDKGGSELKSSEKLLSIES